MRQMKRLLLLIFLSTVFLASHTPPAKALVFVPVPISVSDTEITNPYRGSYEWNDEPVQPPNWPITDGYMRLPWKDLESDTVPGEYDFSKIEAAMTHVQAYYGGKTGLRVMAANSFDDKPGVPQYLVNLMPKGFWFVNSVGVSVYAPDWNDPYFLNRSQALLEALGAKYSEDPRLGWIDIGIYGDFGEWHLAGWPYSPSPTGAVPMTTGNKCKIIDYHIQNFPNNHLVMVLDDSEGFSYALSSSPRVGLRADNIGDYWLPYEISNRFSESPAAAERWKTAPFITEFYNWPSMEHAYDQISDYHVSMIGNGNIGNLDDFSEADQYLFKSLNKLAGYRFVLKSLTIPSPLATGVGFTVSSRWSNVNVAPAYLPWDCMLQLRQPSTGAVTWQMKSSLDLRTLLPTTDQDSGLDTPVTLNDHFTIGYIPAGRYDVVIIVQDHHNYYPPLALAIQGRQADGSYLLGQVTVLETPPPAVLVSAGRAKAVPFPQPAQTYCKFVFFVNGEPSTTLQVYNLMGERVATLIDKPYNINNFSIIELDTQNLGTGVFYYILEIKDDAGIRRLKGKFAVER